MNNRRRERLKKAIYYLGLAEGIVETAAEEEEDCLDNMPENMLESDRCEKMERAVEHLEEALENIEHSIEEIEAASE